MLPLWWWKTPAWGRPACMTNRRYTELGSNESGVGCDIGSFEWEQVQRGGTDIDAGSFYLLQRPHLAEFLPTSVVRRGGE